MVATLTEPSAGTALPEGADSPLVSTRTAAALLQRPPIVLWALCEFGIIKAWWSGNAWLCDRRSVEQLAETQGETVRAAKSRRI